MSRFQLLFTGALIFLGVGGVIMFAIAKNETNGEAPKVVMWGTLDGTDMSDIIAGAAKNRLDKINVDYVQKNRETFEDDLIAALARGAGPDLILLPQDLMLKQLDKFYITSFDDYSERTFRDSFIQEGELYLTSKGIVGFPFSIDPMVMYWNRDHFTSADAPLPPTTWTDFFPLVPKLTRKDERGNITQSFVAFGEMRNVVHAKDVVAMLSIQAGTPIVAKNELGSLASVFSQDSTNLSPAEEAVSFYTEFSNPVKSAYSWNRALLPDRDAFIAGKLSVYFGYASELSGIRSANPNLNFDVAMVPQTIAATTGGARKMTFGRMNAIAVLRSSRNLASAHSAMIGLTDTVSQTIWNEKSGYPPVRRDLLVKLPGDAYKAVFYRSALISNAWLDPNKEKTDDIFTRLIENVTSGRQRVSEAVSTASIEIGGLINKRI